MQITKRPKSDRYRNMTDEELHAVVADKTLHWSSLRLDAAKRELAFRAERDAARTP